mmetsp:Transcript_49296/g.127067  ORF Transcript_49296/g.127067 Transcript_49296/m.127067 type:complete len:319 (-) Transcript_49296:51-1007(-)
MQGSFLQLVLRPERLQVVEHACAERNVLGLGRLVLHPGVIQRLLRRESVLRLHLEESPDQILGILRNILPIRVVEGEVAEPNLRQHICVSVPVERGITTEQHICDDAATPDVHRLVVLPSQNLRGHVVRSTGLGGHDNVWPEHVRQAEVDDLEDRFLNRGLGGEEEVFGLEVSMADVVLVHVVDGAENVLHDSRRLHLGEVARVDDAVEQLTTIADLHHQINIPLVLERLMQLDDVGMVHDLHDVDLAVKALHVLHGGLWDRFQGPHRTGRLADALGDGAIGALPKFLLVDVVRVRDLHPVVGHHVRPMGQRPCLALL